MAAMDKKLLITLRYLRKGELKYGVQGDYTRYLEPFAEELGYNKKLGNLCETIPIPCKLVHEGFSDSCEAHALYNWPL
jgi:hypothetical protein